MPIGPYKDFGGCVSAQRRSGKSEESAKKICGTIEQNTIKARKEAATTTKYEDNGRLYIRAFLLSSDLNVNRWGVTPESLDKKINTFIGKPLVLTSNFNHPLPPDLYKTSRKLEDDEYSSDDHVDLDEVVDHWLAYQESYRIGTIIDIVKKNSTYYAIIEVTDEAAKDAFHNNDLPLFVSPAIAQLDPREKASSITEWTGIHLAIVSDPAYTIQKALITNQCNGESDRCLLQLRQASIIKNKGHNCGFCRYEAFKKYAEITRRVATNYNSIANVADNEIVIRIASSYDDLVNSSIAFSDSNVEIEKLTEPTINNETNDSSQNTEVKTEEETTTKTAEEILKEEAVKVANLQECVQIFQQNGIQDPKQAQQICQLAMQAFMKSYGPQGPAGGGNSNMGPPQSGKFAEIEKEKVKLEAQVEKLSEELKSFKKGNKSDAERIAELETTVTNLLTERKEKEIELYLLAKIPDEKKRKEKTKRYAELNLSMDDLKDIYEELKQESTNKVEKVANVEVEKPKPKVKLHTASTKEESESEDNTANEIKEANSRIVSSFFPNKGVN